MVILGVCFFLFCILPPSGPLEAYLESPPVIHNPPWDVNNPPEKSIPMYMERFNNKSSSSREKGIALANLADIANQMSQVTPARKAAADLLENVVMPNLDSTRAVETTSSCSWRQTLSRCKGTYQNLGNSRAARDCLELLHTESENMDDQDMAIYLLAYEYAKIEDYHSAIWTIQRLPAASRWTASRPELIRIWMKKKLAAEQEQIKWFCLSLLIITVFGGSIWLFGIIRRSVGKEQEIA